MDFVESQLHKQIKENSTAELPFKKRVKHVMSTDIFSVDENDSLDLVINIMQWKKFHHMPVINAKKELVCVNKDKKYTGSTSYSNYAW